MMFTQERLKKPCHRQAAGDVVLAPDAFRQLDAMAVRDTPLQTLIDRAGWCVARAIMRRYAPRRVLVICGPGHNGRDGLRAAQVLARRGWSVRVAFSDGVGTGCQPAHAGIVEVPMTVAEAARADLVVDAVFGAGLNRPPVGAIMAVLQAARARVAIDVPTGVDGATGEIMGKPLDYLLTVTFVRLKPAHLLHPARKHMGEIICADIGISDDLVKHCASQIFHNWPSLWRVPRMSESAHKYARGVVSLCGGSEMPGATCLAADAARCSGAGVVRIAAPAAATLYRQVMPADVIVDDAPLAELIRDARRQVWVCGPGLSINEVGHHLRTLIASQRQIVADAGALRWAAGNPERLRGATVLTPHDGEFHGLCGQEPSNRIAAAISLAMRVHAVVVLKGPSTVIAAPDGRVAINTHASAKLATAGSGDTLSGVIATLLATGMESWSASCAAVWIHGEAGHRAGPWPVAGDFARHLGAARESAERGLLNV